MRWVSPTTPSTASTPRSSSRANNPSSREDNASYRIAGTYVLNCNCQLICPCGVDGPPTSKDGHCRGAQVLHISEGNKDGVDLANIDFGWVYELPGNVTSGNWTSALIIDPSAS